MTINEILKIENVTEKIVTLYDFCSKQEVNTDTEKVIISIEDFENDVMNGGFSQYYKNKTESEVNQVLIDLEKIGAKKSKALFEKFLLNQSLDEELTDEFIKYEDNIQALMIKYTENNIKDFNK